MAGGNNILLESGTNELEILIFKVDKGYYGINIAKVKEIINYCDITEIPNVHPCISGLIKPRESIIIAINLPKYLNLPLNQPVDKSFFIITHFNKVTMAFQVSSVVGIKRLSWEDIEKPPTDIYGGVDSSISGIVKNTDNIITILDFEKIIFDISPKSGIQASEIQKLGPRKERDTPILIAEDSQMLVKVLEESIRSAGYNNLTIATNGKEAWDLLENAKKEKGKNIKDAFSCVITDIEMPQMDGHHLTKRIKEDSILKEIPVIIFSSLISEEMIKKGKSIGADAQITKPEICKLVDIIDELI
ncbi:chemotaxis protein [Tissierella praeacuta]|uniref:chemotaxis protein n=1 Tax=Tissierella praeacuta TaxID=43131 RepID=UPI0033427B04